MPKVKQCFVQGNVEDNNVYMTSGLQPPTDADLVYRTEVSAYMQPFSSGGCYSDDVQVLTDQGWKYFKDLDKTEKFYTMNPKTEKIELQSATKYFEYDFDGDMIHFQSRVFDLLVTPNHNMVYKMSGKEWKFRQAEEFLEYTEDSMHQVKFPRKAIWDVEIDTNDIKNIPYDLDAFLEFLGYFISDGCVTSIESLDKEKKKNNGSGHYGIYLTAKKDRKVEKYRNILKKLGIVFSEQKSDSGAINFTIGSNKTLWNLLSPLGKAKEKYIPKEILNLPSDKLEILLNSLIFGDGCTTDGKTKFYTSSSKLAENIEELCLKTNKSSFVCERTRDYNIDGREGTSISYEINIKNTEKRNYFRTVTATKEYYKGKVYCVTVPNHTLFVKRKKSPTWCGNSIEHIFLGGKVSNNMKTKLIQQMFSTPINYITLSPIVSICTSCNTKHIGEFYKCPNCGDDEHMMVYSRVIGYIRPIVSGKVKIENNTINGDENYWQDSRRVDWVERDKVK